MSGRGAKVAGFVLAGGRSTRMGHDKALLRWSDSDEVAFDREDLASDLRPTLLQLATAKVRAVVGNVTILGDPALYGHLGFPVFADLIPDCGPMGGLYTALNTTEADWNLVVACDMPQLSEDLLGALLIAAEASAALAVVPEGGRGKGLDPLCAVYHRQLLPAVESAIQSKLFKLQTFLPTISLERWQVPPRFLTLGDPFRNLNSPHDLMASDRGSA